MDITEMLKKILIDRLDVDEVYVYKHDNIFNVIVVGSCFLGLSRVMKHKIVYAPLTKFILNNDIHAISIKVYTPNEWKGIDFVN
ncbi:MAG: acid stress protein IbaG [Candidatus Westeberhardia cardiocondylae]|nr:acid stress protein IbaG [Candidatus Westeberhardia cardiocondylae]